MLTLSKPKTCFFLRNSWNQIGKRCKIYNPLRLLKNVWAKKTSSPRIIWENMDISPHSSNLNCEHVWFGYNTITSPCTVSSCALKIEADTIQNQTKYRETNTDLSIRHLPLNKPHFPRCALISMLNSCLELNSKCLKIFFSIKHFFISGHPW